ncbi:MAG: glycosyltransferase [Armatimonadetes bacterium]|nr:glycosyltransferase [Armatimonadota bacterium]
MKILHVGWGHPPEHIGDGTVAYTQELCEQLALKGHRNALLAASPLHVEGQRSFSVCRRDCGGTAVYAVTNRRAPGGPQDPAGEVSNPDCEQMFRRMLHEIEPEMVHFHSIEGFCASLIPTAREYDLPTVVSMHDFRLICPRGSLVNRQGEVCADAGNGAKCGECLECTPTCESAQAYADRYSRMIEWLGGADMILAESDFMLETLLSHGIPEGRIARILPAAKTAEALWAWKHRREHDSGGPITFGYVGEISRTKAPHLLVEAASMLEDIRDRLRISMQGRISDPQYSREIEQKVLKLQHRLPAVAFGADYDHSMLHRLLSETDVCVCPTLAPENPPRTVLEALGARVPVIASAVGGLPDVVRHCENGLLFERGNAESLALQMRCVVEHRAMPRHLRVRIKAPRPMAVHAGEISAVYETLAIRAAMRRGPEEREAVRKAA